MQATALMSIWLCGTVVVQDPLTCVRGCRQGSCGLLPFQTPGRTAVHPQSRCHVAAAAG